MDKVVIPPKYHPQATYKEQDIPDFTLQDLCYENIHWKGINAITNDGKTGIKYQQFKQDILLMEHISPGTISKLINIIYYKYGRQTRRNIDLKEVTGRRLQNLIQPTNIEVYTMYIEALHEYLYDDSFGQDFINHFNL